MRKFRPLVVFAHSAWWMVCNCGAASPMFDTASDANDYACEHSCIKHSKTKGAVQ